MVKSLNAREDSPVHRELTGVNKDVQVVGVHCDESNAPTRKNQTQ